METVLFKVLYQAYQDVVQGSSIGEMALPSMRDGLKGKEIRSKVFEGVEEVFICPFLRHLGQDDEDIL